MGQAISALLLLSNTATLSRVEQNISSKPLFMISNLVGSDRQLIEADRSGRFLIKLLVVEDSVVINKYYD